VVNSCPYQKDEPRAPVSYALDKLDTAHVEMTGSMQATMAKRVRPQEGKEAASSPVQCVCNLDMTCPNFAHWINAILTQMSEARRVKPVDYNPHPRVIAKLKYRLLCSRCRIEEAMTVEFRAPLFRTFRVTATLLASLPPSRRPVFIPTSVHTCPVERVPIDVCKGRQPIGTSGRSSMAWMLVRVARQTSTEACLLDDKCE
jgi:hypothetical protein